MRRSLVRARKRRRPTSAVAASWQRWIVENLLRGVAPDGLVERLKQGGVPAATAEHTVEALRRSAGLGVARTHDLRAKRLALVSRLCAEVGPMPPQLERSDAPDASTFFAHHWAGSRPAVFTDVIPRWRAQWTPQLLAQRYGGVEIEACCGREGDPRPDSNWASHRMSMELREFIGRMLDVGDSNDLYLIANNRNTARPEMRSLWDDVVLPPGWFADDRLPQGSALWLGPAGTVTPLHHDTSNILFCQIYGRKRVALAPPWSQSLLDTARGVYNGRTLADCERDGIELLTVTLQPGEALFIPVGWWHDVRALDVSVSLAINAFARPNAFTWYVPGSVR